MPEEYILHCIHCLSTKDLQAIAHRRDDGKICGWVFACPNCIEIVYDAEARITFPGRANEEATSDLDS